ncbi:MAG TPA: VanZ family protein [Actinomycetota bacterium]|nr:VanZ family protein [Actinomycetota bacterium]
MPYPNVDEAARVFLAVVPPILIAGLAVLIVRLLAGRRGTAVRHTILDVLLALSIAGIGAATLIPMPGTGRAFTTPFEDLRGLLAIEGQERLKAILIGGNILLFVPLGMALCARLRVRGGVALATLGCLVVSTAVEVMQHVFLQSRWASVDDVMLNTVGGLLGAGLWRLAERPVPR